MVRLQDAGAKWLKNFMTFTWDLDTGLLVGSTNLTLVSPGRFHRPLLLVDVTTPRIKGRSYKAFVHY